MKGLMKWIIGVGLMFSGTVLIYMLVSSLTGKAEVAVSVIWSFFVTAVVSSTLQYLAFTEVIFRKLRYSLRLLIFVVPFGGALTLISFMFQWFPQRGVISWAIFIAIFIAVFILFGIGFEVYYHFAGKKYDGMLGQYKKRHEC